MALTGPQGALNSTDKQEFRDRSEEKKLRLIYEHPTVPQTFPDWDILSPMPRYGHADHDVSSGSSDASPNLAHHNKNCPIENQSENLFDIVKELYCNCIDR